MRKIDATVLVDLLENAKRAIDGGDLDAASEQIGVAITKLGGDKPYVSSPETLRIIAEQRAWRKGWEEAKAWTPKMGSLTGHIALATEGELKQYWLGVEGWSLCGSPLNPDLAKVCDHPEMYIDSSDAGAIPRSPLRYGSAVVEVCSYCKSWRTQHHGASRWEPGPYAAAYERSVLDLEEC